MELADISSRIADLPYTTPRKGKLLYDLVKDNGCRHILELGIAHGGGTSYLAAAVSGQPDASVTAVDLRGVGFEPTAEETIQSLGLEQIVSIEREHSSYTWFLKKEIERRTSPEGHCKPFYDFVFIDGPKDWTNDGAAFFLVDKLLVPGGLIVFDDYDWSYKEDERRRGKSHTRGYIFPHMSEEEFSEPQIEAVFRLLVMQHSSYGDFRTINNELAVARKMVDVSVGERSISLREEIHFDLGYKIKKLLKKIRRKFRL